MRTGGGIKVVFFLVDGQRALQHIALALLEIIGIVVDLLKPGQHVTLGLVEVVRIGTRGKPAVGYPALLQEVVGLAGIDPDHTGLLCARRLIKEIELLVDGLQALLHLAGARREVIGLALDLLKPGQHIALRRMEVVLGRPDGGQPLGQKASFGIAIIGLALILVHALLLDHSNRAARLLIARSRRDLRFANANAGHLAVGVDCGDAFIRALPGYFCAGGRHRRLQSKLIALDDDSDGRQLEALYLR